MSKISDYSILDILKAAAVETKKAGSEIVCRCPICKSDNNLTDHNCQVNVDKNNIYCFSENKAYSRTELIKELDLYNVLDIKRYDENTITEKPAKPAPVVVAKPFAEPSITEKAKIIKETVYEFKDINNNLLYKKYRKDFNNKTKDIKYDKPAGQGIIFYGLETLADPDDINYIFFTEGEKCAEAVRNSLIDTEYAYNTAVLSFNNPASEWQNIGKEAQDIILSKNIIIFSDHDEPGKRKADELFNILKKPLKIVDFYDKDAGYDIADWLADGGTVSTALKIYLKDYKPTPEPEQSEPNFDRFKKAQGLKINETMKAIDAFGLPIEFGSIGILAGATSAGKTEYTAEIADYFAKQDKNNISLLCYFEGSDAHINQRLALKGIDNENVFYIIEPSFTEIEIFVKYYAEKGKKILIFIDYLQKQARMLRLQDKTKSKVESLAVYIDIIFDFFNKLRNKYQKNICIYLINSFSKSGISDIRLTKDADPIVIQNAIKESGDISYDVDFGFCLLFACREEMEKDAWALGRKRKNIFRNYMLLFPFKDSRINGANEKDVVYSFDPQTRRYNMIDTTNNYKNTEDKYYENANESDDLC